MGGKKILEEVTLVKNYEFRFGFDHATADGIPVDKRRRVPYLRGRTTENGERSYYYVHGPDLPTQTGLMPVQ